MTDDASPAAEQAGDDRRRGRHASGEGRAPGGGLVAVGTVLFLVGLVAVSVAVVPVLLGTSGRAGDVPAVLAGTLLPLGLGLALGGVLRSARARRRAARRSADRT